MAGPSPLPSTNRGLVAILGQTVSIGLTRWIEQQLRDGAELADIERMLALALRQIGRVNRHRQAALPLPAPEETASR